MSLNSIWYQRAINALEKRSGIAATNVTEHWLVWKYSVVSDDSCAPPEFYGGATPACQLPSFVDASTNILEWSTLMTAKKGSPHFTRQHVQCRACEEHRRYFVEQYGHVVFRQGHAR